MTVDELPKTPSTAFVNDIKADLFDEQTAYIALDNHKFGDYQPYLFKTTDGGKKWTSISEGIPDGTLIWRIVQDHINPNLLFLELNMAYTLALIKEKMASFLLDYLPFLFGIWPYKKRKRSRACYFWKKFLCP